MEPKSRARETQRNQRSLNLTRVQSTIDVDRMRDSTVAVFGMGGAIGLASGLVRCGLGSLIAIDGDTVDETNPARQGHQMIGMSKVESARRQLLAINPNLRYSGLQMRDDEMSFDQRMRMMQGVDLLIAASDNHQCQANCNILALKTSTPVMMVGLYAGAGAGEIFFWTPDHEDCYRCFMEKRFHKRESNPEIADPASDGALIQDIGILDGIAGHIAMGIMTRGSNGYFGGLIRELGDRQVIQVKLRHDYRLNGSDPVRSALNVSADNDAYVCWTSAARKNGPRQSDCPDCIQHRGRVYTLESQEHSCEEDVSPEVSL